jgi:hypothetical protein
VLFYIFLEYCFTWVWNLVYFLKGRKWLRRECWGNIWNEKSNKCEGKAKILFSLELKRSPQPSFLRHPISFLQERELYS